MMKVTSELFAHVAGRMPTDQEMRTVLRITNSYPANHPMWESFADGIPVVIYGAIMDAVEDAKQPSVTPEPPRWRVVRDDIIERYANIERVLDPSNVTPFLFDCDEPRKYWRWHVSWTWKQKHLAGRMRIKKKTKRARLIQLYELSEAAA